LVFWPSLGTNIAMDVTAEISGQTGAVASCVSAYDGDLWSHLLFDRGTLRDRFCSRPDYFEEESGNAADLVRRWTGDPETVAAILEVSLAEVAPYLRPLSDDDFESGDEIRAHPDDEVPWTTSGYSPTSGVGSASPTLTQTPERRW
jgi:hypothetical protein